MQYRNEGNLKAASGWLAAGGLAVLLLGCSTEPYQIETTTNPPWKILSEEDLPALDPPLSHRAHRIALCYGTSVNSEADILAWAEEICGGGRLVLEDQNAFWNGCSVLQPTRVTYICDPLEEAVLDN
jgi:hypothetical protein